MPRNSYPNGPAVRNEIRNPKGKTVPPILAMVPASRLTPGDKIWMDNDLLRVTAVDVVPSLRPTPDLRLGVERESGAESTYQVTRTKWVAVVEFAQES